MAIEKENIQVSIPSDFVPFVSLLKDGKTVDEKVKLSLAIGFFLSKTVTLAKAAELAGKSLYIKGTRNLLGRVWARAGTAG